MSSSFRSVSGEPTYALFDMMSQVSLTHGTVRTKQTDISEHAIRGKSNKNEMNDVIEFKYGSLEFQRPLSTRIRPHETLRDG